MELKIYRCEHCGNIVIKVKDSKVPLVCCGEKMKELIPGTTDAALEKHVPVYHVNNNQVDVNIGSVDHPMVDVHYIEFIILETDQGIYVKYLKPGDAPKATFMIAENESVKAVYEYCNIHGFWKA